VQQEASLVRILAFESNHPYQSFRDLSEILPPLNDGQRLPATTKYTYILCNSRLSMRLSSSDPVVHWCPNRCTWTLNLGIQADKVQNVAPTFWHPAAALSHYCGWFAASCRLLLGIDTNAQTPAAPGFTLHGLLHGFSYCHSAVPHRLHPQIKWENAKIAGHEGTVRR
jgi:hypothetical protein